MVISKVDINNGTIDNTDITVGTGKTLDLTNGTLTLADDQISGDKIEGGTINSITINELGGSLNCNSENMIDVNIINGEINGVSFGLTTPCTELQLDNINIDGNTISATNENGNLILHANGIGVITTNSNIFTSGVITGTNITGTITSSSASQPNITSVGALDGGSITSNFGNIDVGTSTITSNKLNSETLKTNNIMESYDNNITYIVTVANKTSEHPYNGSGSTSGYLIDGIESPYIEFVPGKTYRFDQSEGTNSTHPLRFYYESDDKTTSYTTNITYGTDSNSNIIDPGNSGAYTEIAVTTSTPRTLFYQCSAHSLMGNQVQVKGGAIESTGDLDSGSITSGFGNIDIGSSSISGGTITGTSIVGPLTTATQTNITSVGTLTSLTVNGDTVITNSNSDNILKVDTTNNRVGINISTPTESLDIVGNTKISGNLSIGGLNDNGTNDIGSGDDRIVFLNNDNRVSCVANPSSNNVSLSYRGDTLVWTPFDIISSGSIDVYNLGILNTPLDADLYIGSDKNNLFVSNGVSDFFQNVNIIDSTLHIDSTIGESLNINVPDTGNPVITSTNGIIDIESNFTTGTILNINNTANDGDSVIGFRVIDGDDNQFTIGVDNGDSNKFKIGTTSIDTNPRLTIDSNGNVGIGKLSQLTPTDHINLVGNITVPTGNDTYNIDLNSSSSNNRQFIGYGTIPIGGIIMWNNYGGVSVPDGWALCNGSNGTPDLRGRFIMSSTYGSINVAGEGNRDYVLENTGGEQYVQLSVNEIPSHTHEVSLNTTTNGQHTHEYNDYYNTHDNEGDNADDRNYAQANYTYSHRDTYHSGNHSHQVQGDTISTGGSSTHENRPPYYVLAYIMRIR